MLDLLLFSYSAFRRIHTISFK